MPDHRLRVISIVGAAMLFGTTGTAQALGPDGATPFGVGTVRIVIGAAALWVFARRLPDLAVVRTHGLTVALGAVGVAVYQPGFFTGTERLGVALGTIVALGSGPAFAGLLDWAIGTRPSSVWAGATALAIVGGGMLVFAGDDGAAFSVVGLLGSLAAGLGYAVYAIAAKRLIDRGVPSTTALAWEFTVGAALLAPWLFVEPLDWLAEPGGLVMSLHLGVLTVGLAYVLYGWGLRAVATSTATSLTLAEPVTAAVLAFVVLDERLGWYGWAGAALVVLGLAVVGRFGTRRPIVM